MPRCGHLDPSLSAAYPDRRPGKRSRALRGRNPTRDTRARAGEWPARSQPLRRWDRLLLTHSFALPCLGKSNRSTPQRSPPTGDLESPLSLWLRPSEARPRWVLRGDKDGFTAEDTEEHGGSLLQPERINWAVLRECPQGPPGRRGACCRRGSFGCLGRSGRAGPCPR